LVIYCLLLAVVTLVVQQVVPEVRVLFLQQCVVVLQLLGDKAVALLLMALVAVVAQVLYMERAVGAALVK
jgi:hypothetical protein